MPPSAQSTLSPHPIETSGVFGPKSLHFILELGNLVMLGATREVNSTNYLKERLSVAVQRGNSAAVLGIMGNPTSICGPL